MRPGLVSPAPSARNGGVYHDMIDLHVQWVDWLVSLVLPPLFSPLPLPRLLLSLFLPPLPTSSSPTLPLSPRSSPILPSSPTLPPSFSSSSSLLLLLSLSSSL